MRRAGAVLIAAVLALAGCKSTDTKDDKTPGGVAGRAKSKDGKDREKDREKDGTPVKGPTWLDDVAKLPGAGTGIPKSNGPSDPRDPNFDAKIAAQDFLGGRVLDPNGKPARNILVRIEKVGGPRGGPADLGIYTKPDGTFSTTGLEPGKTYELIAEATQEGKQLIGSVQTKVPNPNMLIVLRDDLPPSPGGAFPAPRMPDGGTFPPEPRPSDKVGEYIPPTGMTPKPPADGAWAPGGPVTGTPPASIGGTGTPKPAVGGTPGGPIPPPDLSDPPGTKPLKPENVADAPKDPFKPPAVNIPGPGGPPVPPLPKLPPNFDPSSGGRTSGIGTTMGGSGAKLALVDTLERPWDLDSVKPGTLVLVEFMTSTCIPCKQVIPVLKDLQSRYGASGLQVAAVLCDNAAQKDRITTAAKYGRDNNLNYALYVEPGSAGSVRDRFGVEDYPTAVLLDSTGRVLWKGHPGRKLELESVIKQNLGK